MSIFANLVAGVVNSSGATGSGWLAYFYEPGEGSTTLKAVYEDEDLATPAENPYELDDGGRANLFGSGSYRIRVTDADGNLIQDIPYYDASETYADQVILRDQTGYVGTGDFYTGTTVDAALQAVVDSTGALDAEYRHVDAASTVAAVSLQAKLSRIFDVKDFGAVGDGDTSGDDQAEIQAAFTACVANGGGTVWFPAGTYIVKSGITIGSCQGVVVEGDGGAVIRQYADAPPAAFTLFTVNASTVATFKNLTFYGGGTNAGSAAICIDFQGSAYGKVDSCVFTGPADGTGFNTAVRTAGTYASVVNCNMNRIYHTTAGYGVNLAGASFARVEHCSIVMDAASRGGYGVCVTTGAGVGNVVSDCYISGAAQYGVTLGAPSLGYCTASAVRNCYITACQAGGINATTCDNSTVDGNTLYQNLGPGVMSDVRSASNTAGALRLTVKGNRIVGTTGSTDGVFLGGTDNAAAAAHSTACIVDGNVIESMGQHGVYLSGADYCTVSNNIIKECSTTGSGSYAAIRVYGITANTATAGGRRNKLFGNQVLDSATSYHKACVEMVDSSGASATNVSETECYGNSFPTQNGGGTPRTFLVSGSSLQQYYPRLSQNLFGGNDFGDTDRPGGLRLPVKFLTTTGPHTLTMDESGYTIVCDATTAGGLVVVLLPRLGTSAEFDGAYFDVVVSGAGGAEVRQASGSTDTIVGDYDGSYPTGVDNASARFVAKYNHEASGVGNWVMLFYVGHSGTTKWS